MSRTIDLFFLSEINVPRLLWRAAWRKPAAVIGIRPLWPVSTGPLQRLKEWAEKKGLCRPLPEVLTGAETVGRDLFWEETYDVFQTVEPWAEDHLRFADAAGDYAMAFKHTACGFLNSSTQALFDLRAVDQTAAGRNDLRVVGADAELVGMYSAYFGSLPTIAIAADRSIGWLINLSSFVGVSLSCLGAITRRLRLRARPEAVFLGWDFGASKPLVRLLGEMADSPDRAMVVFRNDWMAAHYSDWATEYRRCTMSDGVFSPPQAISAVGMTLRHLVDLSRRFGYLPPAVFRLTLALVYRRLVTRALLHRYRFEYFWSHDDYNVEHIIRSQEIRRIGGRSLGINHGMAVPEGISPMWRYIDFDIYYVFGIGLYEKFYRKTWAPDMAVKDVGSYGMSRDQLARVGDQRRPDIVFFFNTSAHEAAMIDAVVEVATAFPDRTVFAKIKSSRKEDGMSTEISKRCASGPKNLVETEEDSYELMLRSLYALSSRSTIVAESIQFGLKTFVFDFTPAHRYSYYREFPDLIVRSGSEVIRNIRAIESASWTYPRDAYASLVDQSGKVIFDVIRVDLGLVEKQPGTQLRLPEEPDSRHGKPSQPAAGGLHL